MKLTDKVVRARLVLLTGDDPQLRLETLKRLQKLAIGDGDDFDSEQHMADKISLNEWCALAGSAPFLSDRRVITIRNLLRADPPGPARFKADDPSLAPLRTLPETGLLILVADDESGDESRQRTLKARSDRWTKTVEAVKGEVLVCSMPPKQVMTQLRERAKEHGKTLSASAANLLTEYTGSNWSRGVMELEKLRLYVGDRPEISDEDVRRLVVPEGDYNVFQLVDAVIQGNPSAALGHLQVLFHQNARQETHVFSMLFPSLIRQLRLLYQARMLVDARASLASLPPGVAEGIPEEHSLLKVQDWLAQKIVRSAQRLSLAQIGAMISEVVLADAKLKGQEPAHGTYETLEVMVLRMAEVTRTRAATGS